MTDESAAMASSDIYRRRYPHTVDRHSGITPGSNANQSGRVHTAVDTTPHVQILDGTIADIAEERARLSVTARNVNRQRMAIAVEGATIGGILVYSDASTGGDVSLQGGIHPILAPGLLYFVTELVPIVVVTDSKRDSRCLLNP